MHVMKSLMHEWRVRPGTGWIRADQARSKEDLQREQRLIEQLDDAKIHIEILEREIRDRTVLIDDVPKEALAQGNDIFEFSVTYQNANKKHISEKVLVSWDDVFRLIGTYMDGYVV